MYFPTKLYFSTICQLLITLCKVYFTFGIQNFTYHEIKTAFALPL